MIAGAGRQEGIARDGVLTRMEKTALRLGRSHTISCKV